jgi:hypothetical protein
MRRNKKVNLLVGDWEKNKDNEWHFVNKRIVEVDAYVFEYKGIKAFIHKYNYDDDSDTDYWQGNEFVTSQSFTQNRIYSKTGKKCIEFVKKVIDKRRDEIVEGVDKFLIENDPVNTLYDFENQIF